jgi:hypothetical protein
METNEQIENNFRSHLLTDEKAWKCEELRGSAKRLAYLIERNCPNSREKSLAMTKLEEALMWANTSVARNE